MRFWAQAAVLLPAVASALYIPPTTLDDTNDIHDITTVVGRYDQHHLSVRFRIPCRDCPLVLEGSSLEIEIDVPKSHQNCGDSYPRINGVELSQQSSVSGPIHFTSKFGNESGDRNVLASWTQTCLDNQASLLSLRLHDIDGEAIPEEATGFALSYQQHGEVKLLRLQTRPVLDSENYDVQQAWLHPSQDQEVTVLTEALVLTAVTPDVLQEEYRKLDNIKISIGDLFHELHEQESKIYQMLKQDMRACRGMGCLVQNAIKRLPDFAQLLKAHFTHHPQRPLGGHHDLKHKNCSRDISEFAPFADIDNDESFTTTLDALSGPPPPPPSQPPPFQHPDHLPFDGDEPFPPPPPPPGHHHGPPPPPAPGHHHGLPPPPPPGHHHGPPPPPGHHDGRPGHGPHGPPPFHGPHHWHRHHHIVLSAAILIVIVVCAALTFKVIRKHTSLFKPSRRSVRRAERREERLNRRAYRKAACQQRWKTWWNRCRRPSGTEDYEEKRAMIVHQEGVLENVMQEEIRNLRTAHQLAGEMVRVEEGRQRLYREANTPPSHLRYGPSELEAGSSMLPAYLPPPPTYEEDMAGEIHVVDGFTYTPSDTDFTPDSSVVDCNPRLSMDTGTTVGPLDSKGVR